MSDYFVDENGNVTTKKKKKKQYTVDFDGNIIAEEEEDDIAPPISTNNGYFTKGSDEGVAKSILGTLADFGEDLTAGFIGIGEKAVDAFAWLAPMVSKSQYIANGGGMGFNQEADRVFEEQNEAAKESISEFMEKDLYDEQKVAKQILGAMYGSADNINKLQAGMMLSDKELLAQQQKMHSAIDYMDNEMELDSYLGEKADSLVQSGGQLLGTAALTALGIPAEVVIGLTSFGSEAEEAFKQGATYEQAGFSGLVSAGAEILSEKISGGISFGGKTLDDAATDWLARNVTNKALRTMMNMGMDVVGEGMEEVVSGYMSAIGKKLSYMSEKEMSEIFTKEEAWDSFLGGAILGGVGTTGKVIGSKINGVDSTSGMTADEETVVRKLYDQTIDQKKKDGKTMNSTEKAKLWDDLTTKLEKGYISAEDVESVLGGESYETFKTEMTKFNESDDYKAYRKAVEAEETARAEFEPLADMVTEKMTGKQIYRRDELKKILDESKVKELKAKIDPEAGRIRGIRDAMRSEVMERVKDSKLAESYRELERKRQKFTVDINQYEGKAKETVQKIIDSGLGDNTNQFHDTVDFLAKISNDKDVTFDFTETKRLKGTKHYKEGYITNGFVNDNGDIMLNMDSKNVLQTTVGHEITHVLEKTDSYKALQAAVRDYCISKEGLDKYNARVKAAEEAYKGNKNTTVDAEVTADIIGEYLFNDSAFVNKLSVDDRSTFEKIYDEIKYLFKIATAGSKEKRDLEKVKKVFDQAWRENVKGKATEDSEAEPKTEAEAEEATIDPENDADLDYESPVKYSVSVKDQDTIDFLENQEHITTYKAMILVDGKLYPPMASKVKGEDGKYHMTNPRELGEWMQAEEDTTNIKFNDKGVGYYDLKKDDGGTVRAAYNPYEHSSNLVLNDQFETAYKRENLVTVECVIPKSEMDTPYKAEYAKDSTGVMDWHSGVVAGKLTDNKRSVYLSRYLKAVRIVPDSEVAQKYQEIVGDLAVPFNVVSPGLLTELENVGVNIDYDGSPQYQYLQRRAAEREAKKAETVQTLEGGSVTKYSLSTWTPETQNRVKDDLLDAGFNETDIDKWISDTNGVAAVIAADKARLDFEAADNQVMLKDNQEYIKTLDASTLCAKRLVYQGTFDAIQHRMPDRMLSSDDLIDLLNMMKAKGVQTPCGVCYVESRRRHLGKFAQQWLDSYEGEYKPRLDELTTSDGLEKLRKSHYQAYKDFTDAMSKKGSSNPKVVQLRTEYRNDIMSLTPAQIRKIEAIGGLRVQSFSDFETPHLLDMMQAVMDMSAKGLHSQAYTKVPNFAWVFGDTGIKINLSLIAEGNGFDADGNLAFSSTEGMDINEAMKLRDAYSKNVGTIIVGANDAHILACMADDRIDYIIPFHRSGWGMNELKMMGMNSYTDYTYGQKEHDLNKPTKVINGVQQYAGLENLYPPDYWNYELSGKENAERYLNLCAKLGREPKFAQFLVNNGDGSYSLQPDGSTDGYWKTLIDFKMYDNDGKGAAQQKVLPNFNMDEAYRVLNEYEGGANTLPVANDIVEEFVAKYQGDSKYSFTKDSDGNQLTVEQQEFFKDSKVTDSEGNLKVVYHGSPADFNTFSLDYLGTNGTAEGYGFYFTDRKNVAEGYANSYEVEGGNAGKLFEVYLNIKKPLSDSKLTMTKEQFKKFLTKLNGYVDSNGDRLDVLSNYGDVEWEGLNAVLNTALETEYDYCDSDVDLVQSIINGCGDMKAVFNVLRDTVGYDGIIVNEASWGGDQTIYIAFHPDQIKNIDNAQPTTNPDIRYSISPEGEEPAYGYVPSRDIGMNDPLADFAPGIGSIAPEVENTTAEHPIQDDENLEAERAKLAEKFQQRREELTELLKDKNAFFSKRASELYLELRGLKKGVKASDALGYLLDTGYEWSSIRAALINIRHTPGERVNMNSAVESIARQMLNEEYEDLQYDLDDLDAEYEREAKELGKKPRMTRKALHESLVEDIRGEFARRSIDFDETLKNAKNLSTFATVDNTPQRVMEKALGYKAGNALADLTVNKVAQNETEGIKWLNSITDRKNGLLARLSKQYHIKPGSKESAAAQMYAEGFYVNENNEIVEYGDRELAMDFPNINVQNNIKGLAHDPRIRKFYDDTLTMINESRTRNLYPEIPRLDNYHLHFRAMDDTFSRLGLPFNPNDIRAKDLPTDLNGVTADLKPGQPYFASAKHREGKRTSFDILGGLERYATSAKNQIYHIDDIQKLRALRNYIADTYGQANGLSGLDELTEEEAQERIKEVYNSHLSTFAKFLNEEANVLAGKTALIDRGIEGIIGRRGITFLDTVSKQVGSNLIGYSMSSPLTSFDAIPRAFVKANKADFIKAFGQMVVNKVSGRNDGFVENSPVIIRRKGADRFYRTTWQKMSDPGYALMGMVDEISTELIARAKYNELTRKGMDSQQAHFETDKWVSKLMGDRSMGQQPQIFNSKMLGLLTKFQLEVRNNLDSMFYDSIQEAKVSNEDIQNNLERNAKTAAKATATITGLAIAQHLFGMAFESVAGYNPSFDIIEAIIKAFGWDDDEEEPVLDNIEEAFLTLVDDLPYSSTFTGGRIPIQNALPIAELVKGVDQYGNEKSRWETLAEIAPYYLLPGGYGQIKKTAKGLSMFNTEENPIPGLSAFLDEHPIAGSYTDSGDLRFPVEDDPLSVAQALMFGQYSSKNARDYFDKDWVPLGGEQIEEYMDVDLPYGDYQDYRKGLRGLTKNSEKADYINSLDIEDWQKNILLNNILDREEYVDMSDYGEYSGWEEFDYAQKNPGKHAVSHAIADWETYNTYKDAIKEIKGENRKSMVTDYIDSLNLDYGQKILLFKSIYPKDDTYNSDIFEYVKNRSDISYEDKVTILRELGFTVLDNGDVYWD